MLSDGGERFGSQKEGNIGIRLGELDAEVASDRTSADYHDVFHAVLVIAFNARLL